MSDTPRTSAWWRAQYPGWPSMSRERMEMLFSDLAASERLGTALMGAATQLHERAEKADDTIATLRRELEEAKAVAVDIGNTASDLSVRLHDANAKLSALTLDNARKTEALKRARRDFDGPVGELCKMTNTHPFTLAIADIDAALAAAKAKLEEA